MNLMPDDRSESGPAIRRPDFAVDGVEIAPRVVGEDELVHIAHFIDSVVDSRAGARSFVPDANLGKLIACDGLLGALACRLMSRDMYAVRVLCFDKTPTSNWGVPWHQDRTIAVRERREVEGFGPWSVKAGVPHVEPPHEILLGMVALRLHVDPCPASNGALEVLLRSWSWGRLAAKNVAERSASESSFICTAAAGDVVAMRGLTVHASKPSRNATRRRVLHVDFADHSLPDGLQWAMVGSR